MMGLDQARNRKPGRSACLIGSAFPHAVQKNTPIEVCGFLLSC
jgi:hypothetical protein